MNKTPERRPALAWRCECGAVTGRVAPPAHDTVLRIVCHCRYCQAIQHHLGRQAAMLDAHGGTDLAGMSPAALVIDGGRGHIRALRLSERGPVRWHAGCCSTSIANTPGRAGIPHAGVHVAPLVAANGDEAVERTLGPVRTGLFGRDATGGPAPDAHRSVPMSLLPPMLATIAWRRLRGKHRASTLHGTDGRPVVEPVMVDIVS